MYRGSFLTSLIESYEERAVALFDIPGSYLHDETDKDVIMALEGLLEELMIKLDPSLYKKYVTTKSKGKPLLYVNIHKVLYEMLCSSILFYKKLVEDPEDYGFGTNEYDPCVANKTVNGSYIEV